MNHKSTNSNEEKNEYKNEYKSKYEIEGKRATNNKYHDMEDQDRAILRKIGILCLIMCILIGIVGCSYTTANSNSTTGSTTSAGATSSSTSYEGTNITCDGATVTIDGEGATEEDGVVTIATAGTYIFTGTWEQGQIYVDADKEADVQIVLNNVSISNSDTSVIYAKKAGNVTLTIADGTENTIEDTRETIAVAKTNEMDMPGGGQPPELPDGQAPGGGQPPELPDGQRPGKNQQMPEKDAESVSENTVASVKEAEQNNEITTEKTIEETIEENTEANTEEGTEESTENNTEDEVKDKAAIYVKCDMTINGTGTLHVTGNYYHGIKASDALTISEATLDITASEDAINCNDALTIESGNMTISTGDDAIHSDAVLTINGGTIDIILSNEGLEGSPIIINEGTINLTASDDGVNASNADETDVSHDLTINGGSITVDAAGDGLDANGSITMAGGTVTVYGPTNGGNGALDYDGTFTITGGTLIAAGSTGMAQGISDTSTQNGLLISFDEVQEAGTTFQVVDTSGNVILETTPTKEYQCVVVSSPELQQNQEYTITKAGEEVTKVTLTQVMTSIGEDGSEVQTNMLGRGRADMGGNPPSGERPELPSDGERPALPSDGQMPNQKPGNNQSMEKQQSDVIDADKVNEQ